MADSICAVVIFIPLVHASLFQSGTCMTPRVSCASCGPNCLIVTSCPVEFSTFILLLSSFFFKMNFPFFHSNYPMHTQSNFVSDILIAPSVVRRRDSHHFIPICAFLKTSSSFSPGRAVCT